MTQIVYETTWGCWENWGYHHFVSHFVGKMMIIHPLEYSECPIFKQSHMEIYGDIHQNLSPMRPQILVYV